MWHGNRKIDDILITWEGGETKREHEFVPHDVVPLQSSARASLPKTTFSEKAQRELFSFWELSISGSGYDPSDSAPIHSHGHVTIIH